MEQLVIVGSGCAGLTAAIYSSRAELEPLVLTGEVPGGQLTETTTVENYPGFAEGILGVDLMEKMQEQAANFGARIEEVGITSAELRNDGPQTLHLSDGRAIETCALIIATGARPRWLGIESEQALRNRGVSSCATCDGALYRGVPIVVVGGGDTAMEEATFLTRFASKVVVVHRRDELRASKILQERAFANKKIQFEWNSIIQEVKDVEQGEVTGVRLQNTVTGKVKDVECKALFLAIGHIPNTDAFAGQLALDDLGYIKLTDGSRSFTNINGVFAGGDCADHVYRQAVTAAGMGCRAAIDAERWLEDNRCRMHELLQGK